jgi:hypothetical protein
VNENTNTRRPTGQAQEDETLEERLERYARREEQRRTEKKRIERFGK